MELVYLWVEEYKNIQKQGFNFSPRFHCEYNEEKRELTINENDDYIPDFFGENINITAIVGKNGSGKSSVLESILDVLAENPKYYASVAPLSSYHTLLYFKDNQLYGYNIRDKKIINKTDIEFTENQYEEYLLKCIDDLITVNINSEYKEIETRETQQIFSENNKYNKNSSNLVILENYIDNKNQADKIKEDFFIPDKMKISIKSIGYYQSILRDNRDSYSDDDWEKILNLIGTLKDKTFNESLKIIKNIFKLKKEKHQNYDSKKGFIIGLLDDRKSPNQYNFDEDLLKKEIFPKALENYTLNQQIDIKSIDDDFLFYIKKLPYIFEIDLIDKKDINIDSLSFGEKQLLIQLHYILKHSSKKEYQLYHPPYAERDENGDETGEYYGDEYEDVIINNAFIFLDEFEIGLHPQWQKKSINYIVDFLKEFTNIKFHIILTSHSPFLLSDIPKQNIIFLDKGEKGNCKVVDGLKEKKQTFGANIHTLLSDSFFMEEGLMGEFAKSKIDDVINYLHDRESTIKSDNEAQKLIHIIGEPIVKSQLQRMLDSRRLKKVDKIDAIEESIKALQAELARLKP